MRRDKASKSLRKNLKTSKKQLKLFEIMNFGDAKSSFISTLSYLQVFHFNQLKSIVFSHHSFVIKTAIIRNSTFWTR
jgi:hypothetical protein